MSENKLEDMTKLELIKEWLTLKKAEEEFKKERNMIEDVIELLYPFSDGASNTFKEDCFKVNIKKNYVYKFDQKEWAMYRERVWPEHRPEKIEYKVDVKKLKEIEKRGDFHVFQGISDCIEIKRNKSTIKITYEEEK